MTYRKPAIALSYGVNETSLQKLKRGAADAGVATKTYLEEGVPQAVIDVATKKVDVENVVIFRIK